MKKNIPLLMASFLLAMSISVQAQRLAIKIINAVNPTCSYDSNGSANVVVSGGVAPYTYLWEPSGQTTDSATGLFASIQYSLTVTDAVFDTVIGNVTLSSASTLTTSTSSADVSCFGLFNGMATVIPTGGLLPYQYLWQPVAQTTDTANALAAGTYTSTVTDGAGCVAQTTALVAQPAALNVTAFTYASAASATATGGTMPYTYLWYPIGKTTPSVSGLAPGTYTVTITDANVCTNSIVVTVPPAIPPAIMLHMPWNNAGSITCMDTGFFYFPIGIEGDTAERFNNCVMDLYIGDEFKGDSLSNGGIKVMQGNHFLPGAGNDYNILNVTNLSDTVIQIQFGSPVDSSPNGTIVSITATYDTLLCVKLKMQNCKAPLVTFADTSSTSALSNYTVPAGTAFSYPDSALQFLCHCGHTVGWNAESSADSLYCCVDSFDYRYFDTIGYTTVTQNLPYIPTKYYGYVDFGFACDPSITDFNDSVKAGIGDTLTITGNSFGYPRGTGRVEFRDADTLSYYSPQMNDIDYISWTNTQIKIRLPGFVDSIFTNKQNQSTIGGGSFIVGNSCGGGQSSGNNLRGNPFSVFYNIKQMWNPSDTPSQKTEIFLRKTDDSGGYTIRFDPVTFPPGSIQRKIFVRAMKDWTCYTGMNWRVGTDTSFAYNPLFPPPYINYVFMTNSLLSANELALTKSSVNTCNDSINALLFASVYFNSNAKWLYDTTGKIPVGIDTADFYGVCLHELGHFIELNHTTGRWDLMYYAANNGYIDTAHRLTLAKVFSAGAVAGGIYSVQHSAGATGICSALDAMQPSRDSYCVNPFSGVQPIWGNKKENPTFAVYPNPSNGTFTISSTINEYTLVVMNMLGQIILSQKIHDEKTVVSLSTMANGMYFVQERYKNGMSNQKLIIIKNK